MGVGVRLPIRPLGLAVAGLVLLAVVAVAVVVLLGGQVSTGTRLVPRTIYDMGVNWDVACTTASPNDDPAGCSTPLPSLEPAAVAAAVPLEVAALDVPITRTGPMEVFLGSATLANGVLHEASFHLEGIEPGVQVLPSGLEVADTIRLEVRPSDPSRPPFGNGYARGWHPGVEVAKAFLVLDVTGFDPGTMLRIRDVLVR